MTRNLNRRIEIACPIYDREIIDKIKWIISTQLDDNVKASFVTSNGSYLRKTDINYNVKTDSQQVFMEQSMHKKAPEFHTPESNMHKIFSRINSKLKIIFNKSEVK